MAMEKQIILLACLLLLNSISDANNADNDKIWKEIKELKETNKLLMEKNEMLEKEVNELKTTQSPREICEYVL